jgi:CDGSH-type Zn-finger protein
LLLRQELVPVVQQLLCRCGTSTKKPLCDGTHSKIGFQAAAQAVPARSKGLTVGGSAVTD